MKTLNTLLMTVLALTTLASAAPVQLDISDYFNYDAVGTQNEIDYCNTFVGVNHRIDQILGQHNIRYGQSYAGLPEDGLVKGGYYEIGKGLASGRYDVAAGDTAQPNSATIIANNSTATLTVTLDAGDQKQYSDINFLLNGYRYGAESTARVYTAGIEVKYVGDDAWYSLWSDSGDNTGAGGSFTSGGVDGMGHFMYSTDTATWAIAHTTGQYINPAGADPNRYSQIRTGDRYMWEFADALALDSSKTLEAFRMSVSTTGVNRNNQLWLFGATANEVPEPATMSLLALGAMTLLRRRR